MQNAVKPRVPGFIMSRIAAESLMSEQSVRRWLADPESVSISTRLRLRAAAANAGLDHDQGAKP